NAGEHAQRGGMPQAVDASAAFGQEPSHLPAAVADGVVQRRATTDRCSGYLEIGAAVDEGGCHVGVVTAGGPLQRRLRIPASDQGSVRIGACLDQQPDDRGSVGEEAGPVRGEVESGPRTATPILYLRRRQLRVLIEQALERLDIASADR